MTPLHLRRRLRSVVTILAGSTPDEADAWRETARFHAQNEDYYRGLLDKCAPYLGPGVYVQDDGGIVPDPLRAKVPELVRALREARDVEEQCRCDADDLRARAERERDTAVDQNRRLLGYGDELAHAHGALDAADGPAPDVPVWARVESLARQRDEAVALISTLRAEFEAYKSDAASEAKEADRLRAALADVTRDRDALIAKVARLTGEKAPKRKRTKEERWERKRKTLALMWGRHYGAAHDIREAMTRIGRPATSREVIKEVEREYVGAGFSRDHYIDQGMRLVSDLARAGYLTVAKGSGGVRVYSLKENSE